MLGVQKNIILEGKHYYFSFLFQVASSNDDFAEIAESVLPAKRKRVADNKIISADKRIKLETGTINFSKYIPRLYKNLGCASIHKSNHDSLVLT